MVLPKHLLKTQKRGSADEVRLRYQARRRSRTSLGSGFRYDGHSLMRVHHTFRPAGAHFRALRTWRSDMVATVPSSFAELRGCPLVGQWRALVGRGLLALASGALALLLSSLTFVVLLALLAVYSIIHGVLSLIAAACSRNRDWTLVAGLFLLVIAVGTLTIAIAGAVALRADLRHGWVLVLAGSISIVFGYLIVLRPRTGIVVVVAFVSAYAILLGMLLIAAGLRQRRWRSALASAASAGTGR